ncbi:hypothetical protein [Rhizobium leguminosarum]|uniref:hypothetical protein n=1 Tax=Rhizobium leguminosarum TaxID=384 RepID=UPI001C90BB0D|nr:hypothetical protein [Rhizobium leguminosarum]MBY3027481.1 hypothetical protein [Rhizobium leguminosarum]
MAEIDVVMGDPPPVRAMGADHDKFRLMPFLLTMLKNEHMLSIPIVEVAVPYEAVNIDRVREMLRAEIDPKLIADLKFLLEREEQRLLESTKQVLSIAENIETSKSPRLLRGYPRARQKY